MNIEKGKYWDVAWNPVVGCSPISAGCDNCWAARMARRFRDTDKYRGLTDINGVWNGTVRMWYDEQKQYWEKPRVIAVCWMGDLFYDEVNESWIDAVFWYMRTYNQHTYLVLTKRAEQMTEFANAFSLHMGVLPNVWLGVSVENQAAANERVPKLLQCDGWHKWVSVEPMLGPVTLTYVADEATGMYCDALVGGMSGSRRCDADGPRIEQVVCGGESGPGARAMNHNWAARLSNECRCQDVPFFFKQNGEWAGCYPGGDWDHVPGENLDFAYLNDPPCKVWKVGKKRAGRTLDGYKYDELAWAK